MEERLGQADTLAHAFRKFPDVALARVFETHFSQGIFDTLPVLFKTHAGRPFT